jgi:plasmid stabilization system protein ParE
MAFRVEQTDQAAYELELILEWLLTEEAGEAGLKWFHKLNLAISSLAEMPERCLRAPESAESSVNTQNRPGMIT